MVQSKACSLEKKIGLLLLSTQERTCQQNDTMLVFGDYSHEHRLNQIFNIISDFGKNIVGLPRDFILTDFNWKNNNDVN